MQRTSLRFSIYLSNATFQTMLCQISSSYALHEWWLLAKEFQISNFSTSAKKNLVYRKRTLFEKSNFYPKFQFWQNSNILTSFSLKYFLTIFLVKSKLSTAKKSKSTTFSRVFHPKFFWQIFLVKSKLSTAKKSKFTTFSQVFIPKNRQFSREIKVEFLD